MNVVRHSRVVKGLPDDELECITANVGHRLWRLFDGPAFEVRLQD